jgi:Arc/MetJ-type ribon-helix-helix transcriptional regulator
MTTDKAIKIKLPEDLHAFTGSLVRSNKFESRSQVVKTALRILEKNFASDKILALTLRAPQNDDGPLVDGVVLINSRSVEFINELTKCRVVHSDQQAVIMALNVMRFIFDTHLAQRSTYYLHDNAA